MTLNRKTRIRIGHLVFVMAFFAVLEGLVASDVVSALILSRPTEIFVQLWLDLQRVEFWQSIRVTAFEVAAAVTLALVIGSLIGLAFSRLPLFRRAIEPGLVAFYSAPALLLYPLFVTLLGPGSATVIAMAVILGSVPIAINVAVGFAGIEPIWRKVGRSLNASQTQMLFRILVPAAIPTIVTGFRLGLTFSLIAVISLEFLLYSGGLGRLVSWRYFVFDTAGVYSAILLVILISMSINGLLSLLERTIRSRWQ